MADPADDATFMDRALALAGRALGNCWPNPAVGCVLVRDGEVIAQGWTQPGGRPHAEAVALAAAGDAARGATAYVTLEPCAHSGRTGPCAAALAAAGVARVVVAAIDPDPRVSGRGIEMLREAGIAVDLGCREAAAKALNEGFFTRIATGRPFVTLKLATSLDGRIALASGESRWITGPEARDFVHGLRARHDAILVGAGTARSDDPMLDIRGQGDVPRQPVRIVTDASLSLPLTSRLARTAADQPTWILHGPGIDRTRARTFRDLGIELVEVVLRDDGGLDLNAGLAELGARGLTRILCEGGGRLAAGLLRADAVDEMILITSGKVIGAEGIPAIGGLAAEDLDTVPRFHLSDSAVLGADLMARWVSAATARRRG